MELQVKTMAQLTAEGESVDVLFWVGCAGSFDDRAKKITRAFAKILQPSEVNFAVLGSEHLLETLGTDLTLGRDELE